MIQLESCPLAPHAPRAARPVSLDEVLPAAYGELMRIAAASLRRESVGHLLQPAAVVNETYLKLRRSSRDSWEGRAHFIHAAAQAMHHILIDHARTAKRAKRGGDRRREELQDGQAQVDAPAPEWLDLREALALLGARSPRGGRVVQLRFLSGLKVEEVAQELDVSTKTVERDWDSARRWLAQALG